MNTEYTVLCTKCQSKRVRMHNPESLCETAYPEQPYAFDAVATTQAKCDDCGHTFGVEGRISWEQPKMVKTLLKVMIEVEVDADVDKQDLLENIHNALLFSHNVTSKAVVLKENFVG